MSADVVDQGGVRNGTVGSSEAREAKPSADVEPKQAPEDAGETSVEAQVLGSLPSLKISDGSQSQDGEADAANANASANDGDSPIKLFVGGLAWETTEDSLIEVFNKFGEIVDVSVMRHPTTKCSRGFGFVTLKSRSQAEAACKTKHTIDGRVVEAKISAPPGWGSNNSNAAQVNKKRKVFVGGLNAETTDEDFRQYFEQFGEIAESQILQDHYTGRSRGFGFITFTSEEATEKVFAKGRFHELKGKQVEVKDATPRHLHNGRSNSRMNHRMHYGRMHGGRANNRGGMNAPKMYQQPNNLNPYGVDQQSIYYAGYYPPYNQMMQPYMTAYNEGTMNVNGVPNPYPVSPFPVQGQHMPMGAAAMAGPYGMQGALVNNPNTANQDFNAQIAPPRSLYKKGEWRPG